MRATLREWRRRRIYRAVLRELRELPPRQLSDLGIPPAEIPRLAKKVSSL